MRARGSLFAGPFGFTMVFPEASGPHAAAHRSALPQVGPLCPGNFMITLAVSVGSAKLLKRERASGSLPWGMG